MAVSFLFGKHYANNYIKFEETQMEANPKMRPIQ